MTPQEAESALVRVDAEVSALTEEINQHNSTSRKYIDLAKAARSKINELTEAAKPIRKMLDEHRIAMKAEQAARAKAEAEARAKAEAEAKKAADEAKAKEVSEADKLRAEVDELKAQLAAKG